MSMEQKAPWYGFSEYRIYRIDDTVYECRMIKDLKRVLMYNLETGQEEFVETPVTEQMPDNIADVTESYLTEHPEYATKRMEKAIEYIEKDKNYLKGRNLLYALGVNGDREAQYWIGMCFYWDETHFYQPKECNNWLEKAAVQGHVKAQFALARNYDEGFGTEKAPVLAAKWYEKAAENGHAKAAAYTGLQYEWGTGVKKDPEKAFSWYQIAAEKNDRTGIQLLGEAYMNGVGTEVDYHKALEYFELAGEMGNPRGAFCAAKIQDPVYGVDGMEDEWAAERWYQKAKELKSPEAFFYLGLHHMNGTCGMVELKSSGIRMLEEGARLGNTSCMVYLGQSYLFGKNGCEKKEERAFKNFLKAAQGGAGLGMAFLGMCYINEWGTTRDLEQARIWGEKACQAGESHGEEVLEKLDAIEAERKQKEQEEQPKRRGLFGRRKK